jgi:hypothetical protein
MPGENRCYCRDRAKATAAMMEREKFDDGVQLVEESRRLIKDLPPTDDAECSSHRQVKEGHCGITPDHMAALPERRE